MPLKERRRFPRIAVNLNVALLDEPSLPRGCRIRDVSAAGMLLQYGQPDSGGRHEPGRSVTIRVSLKDGEQRQVLLLPARVVRSEDKGLAVAFDKPQAELMQLLEPYELDREEALSTTSAIRASAGQATGGAAAPDFDPLRPRHRRYSTPNGGARLAERIAAAREAIATSGHLDSRPAEPSDQAPAARSDRRLLQLGVLSLAVAVAVVVFDLAADASTNQRLAALESAADLQSEALADVQIKLTADRNRERLARLDNRVEQLATSLAALETGHFSPATEATEATARDPGRSDAPPPTAAQQPAAAAAGTTASLAKANPAATPATPATADPPPASPETPASATPVSGTAEAPATGGPWVINLVSLYDRAAAERFSQRARKVGVEVAQVSAEVQGRPVWRLQVGGFASRGAALAYSEAHKDKLGLDQVWIFKR